MYFLMFYNEINFRDYPRWQIAASAFYSPESYFNEAFKYAH